jgi:hypothetical protein
MKATERVMKAYLSTRKLSVEQAELVRTNLTKFIDELLAARPSRLNLSGQADAIPSTRCPFSGPTTDTTVGSPERAASTVT